MPRSSVSVPLNLSSQSIPSFILPQINNIDNSYLGSFSNPSFFNPNVIGNLSQFNPYFNNYFMPPFQNNYSQFSGISTPIMPYSSKLDLNNLKYTAPPSMANSDPTDKLTSKIRR